jgi:flagellar hook-associated protein 1 FlgK
LCLGDEGIIGGVDMEGHADGIGADNSTGVRFFTMLGTGNLPMSSSDFISNPDCYNELTAKNFCVSSDIINDISKIATSDTPDQIGNIENINKLIKMRNNTHMFTEGAPEDFMKSIVSNLGIDSQMAVRMSANQNAMIRQVENQRLSESGVSMDEEMANMVKHQQAYNAAAIMINTMSEIYDILINRVEIFQKLYAALMDINDLFLLKCSYPLIKYI